jgi:hypothetical protein
MFIVTKKNNDQGVAWHLHTSSNKVPNKMEMDSPLWPFAIDQAMVKNWH